MNRLTPRHRLRGHEWVAYFNMALQYLRTDLCNTCETARNNNSKKQKDLQQPLKYVIMISFKCIKKTETLWILAPPQKKQDLQEVQKNTKRPEEMKKFLINKTKLKDTIST